MDEDIRFRVQSYLLTVLLLGGALVALAPAVNACHDPNSEGMCHHDVRDCPGYGEWGDYGEPNYRCCYQDQWGYDVCDYSYCVYEYGQWWCEYYYTKHWDGSEGDAGGAGLPAADHYLAFVRSLVPEGQEIL